MLGEEYKALCLDKYGGRMHVIKKSFRSLQTKEILVKVHYSTVHPFDILFIKGEYGEIEPRSFPIVPGFEGSGIVVQVEDDSCKNLIGKQVTCFANANKEGYFEGLWAEYHYTTLENIIVIDSKIEIPFEKICFIINPLTAVGMYDTCKKAKVKAVLQTESDGPVGKYFIRLCRKENIIETVNLVKNYTHVKELVSISTPNIIVCEEEWELECKKLCQILNVQIAFDSSNSTHDLSDKIIKFLPEDGTVYHLGSLLDQDLKKIPISELVFKGKSITGFWMVRWLRSLTAEEFQYWWNLIKSDFESGTFLFETRISNIFKLEEIDKAISFSMNNILDGSVLIKI